MSVIANTAVHRLFHKSAKFAMNHRAAFYGLSAAKATVGIGIITGYEIHKKHKAEEEGIRDPQNDSIALHVALEAGTAIVGSVLTRKGFKKYMDTPKWHPAAKDSAKAAASTRQPQAQSLMPPPQKVSPGMSHQA